METVDVWQVGKFICPHCLETQECSAFPNRDEPLTCERCGTQAQVGDVLSD